MNETQIRERLHAVAADAPAPTTVPRTVLRRARARVALTVGASLAIVVAVITGSAVGLRELAAPETRPAAPPPSPVTPDALAYAVDGDVYVAEWDGSNAVRIADGRPPSECGGWTEYWAEGPMWSPDGRYLAYRHENCPSRPEDSSGVVISDPEGNVVAEFPGAAFTRAPSGRISWSPDSTRFATWVTFGETIGVFGLDGARHALLSVPPLTSGPVDPMWLPGGRSLLVPPDIVVPLDGSPPYRLPLADRGWFGGAYSPDGSRLAYVGDNDNPLVVAEADGSHPQVVFDGPVVWGAETSAVWSPAGDRIAFTSSEAGSGLGTVYELRVVDLATGTVTLLDEAYLGVLISVIDFSPDGNRILFSKPELGGPGSLWTVDVDGSDLRRLVAEARWGDWRPPGAHR